MQAIYEFLEQHQALDKVRMNRRDLNRIVEFSFLVRGFGETAGREFSQRPRAVVA